ncbi:MAG: response regulator [Chitinophagaceae bacterium]|nr:response regulator [Chitinophagaceae bacterium]
MNKTGPIIIIEDDPDDQELLNQLFVELGLVNELRIFSDGATALEYLMAPQIRPFLILSDINMPLMNGFQLRSRILNDSVLAEKCIPFLFCTTGASASVVREAYKHSVQGIFQKPSLYEDWKQTLQSVVQYWSVAISPNRY